MAPYYGSLDKIENIIPDTMTGEGIKRTEAFTVELTEDKYKKWKDQFWETRAEGAEWVWEVLKEAVDLSASEAKELLKSKGIKTEPRLGMKMCYDETGKSYVLPPAIINEPVGFGEDLEKKKLEQIEAPNDEKDLTLTLRNASKFDDDEIEISDHSTVVELKEKYAELKDVDDIKKIRLLYYGRELKNDYNLYHYDINEEIILIAVVNHDLDD
mmetsp:Transcript_22561/g.22392  ORF Transcript_22561/g.22392 Transcript_22561/m.22392 type:complete len:213 (+) Transcript_22561:139-777(+)|eukprot:CAMPEP_0197002308 /NCGR_PEP_ID=MMETSP1380-20130617/6829_1 /TAXON_ID=5936 /ORGANISM="Euplotes crassus, Strain CT5" /LENGTH=212 /DNA_ID=CAMNT_0042420377 /DNA_START=136 /DNA_END=774 /DNA_ORIENTATION=-